MTIAPHKNCETPRYQEIARLRSYLKGLQYAGRPDWWTGQTADGKEVPLHERAPCIVYPMPKIATNRVVDFTFGEGHFPTLRVEQQEDDDEGGYSVKLTDEEANALEQGVRRIATIFRPRMAKLMREGLACRTAVAILSLRRGRFHVEIPHAEDCMVEWVDNDPSTCEVKKLIWIYQYEEQVQEGSELKTKRFWFRRDIDQVNVIDYEPVEAKEKKEPTWRVKQSELHGLSFCPVLYIRNCPDNPSDTDGVSIYDGLFEQLDALNFALSQRHRGIRFGGVSQPWETGVEEGQEPAADGRLSRRGYTSAARPGSQPHGEVAGSEAARRFSPDNIWSYEGKDVRVGLLETTGKAYEVTSLHVDDIRKRLAETMQIVLADVDDAIARGNAGSLNAKLLQMLYAPMLALVDSLREEVWWPHGLLAMISMALRIIAARDGVGVLMPGAKKLAAIAKKFEVAIANENGTSTMWMDPPVVPIWGDNFSPSNDEIKIGVEAANAAVEGHVISSKTAQRFVGSYFKVEDVDLEAEDIENEKAEAMAQAQEQAAAMAESSGDVPPAKPALKAKKATVKAPRAPK